MGEPVPAVTVSKGAEASLWQGRDSSIPLLCPAGFLLQGQLPKHTKNLCHNKEINYKTVHLGCMPRPEPREEQGPQEEQKQEQKGWGGKILAPVELPDSTG